MILVEVFENITVQQPGRNGVFENLWHSIKQLVVVPMAGGSQSGQAWLVRLHLQIIYLVFNRLNKVVLSLVSHPKSAGTG